MAACGRIKALENLARKGKLVDKKNTLRFLRSIKTNQVKIKKEAKEDPTRFDSQDITNALIKKLLDTTEKGKEIRDEQKTEDELFNIINKYNNLEGEDKITNSFWKKVKGIFRLDLSKVRIFFDKNGKQNEKTKLTGFQITQRAIVFNAIYDALKTEIDLMHKHNLNKNQRQQILNKGELVPNVGAIGTLQSIGEKVLAIQGIVLAPNYKSKQGNLQSRIFDTEKMKMKVGIAAVEELAKATGVDGKPLISIEGLKKGNYAKVINRNFMTVNGNSFKHNIKLIDGAIIKLNINGLISNIDTTIPVDENGNLTPETVARLQKFLQRDMTKDNREETKAMFPMLSENIEAASLLVKLRIPSNIRIPIVRNTNEKVNEKRKNLVKDDVPIKGEAAKVLQKKFEGGRILNPDLTSLFGYINKLMKNSKKDFRETARDISPSFYRAVVGYTDETLSTEPTRDSDRGRALSKTTPLEDFVDNYGNIMGRVMHVAERMLRNGRSMEDPTVANVQSDKNFARFALGAPEYHFTATENGKYTEVMTHFILGVQDQMGKYYSNKINTILNTGEDTSIEGKTLDIFINRYDKMMEMEEGDAKAIQQSYLLDHLMSNKNIKLSGGSFQRYDSLRGLSTIRKVSKDFHKNDSVVINSTFMPKPDGTASGAVIMAFQLAGKYHTDGSDMFNELFINDSLRDPYSVVENAMIKEFSAKDTLDEKYSELGKLYNFMLDTGIFNDWRDAAKDPTMFILYSQGKESAKRDIATNNTREIYSNFIKSIDDNSMSKTKNFVYDLIGDKTIKNDDGVDQKLVDYINENKSDPDLMSDEVARMVYDSIYNHIVHNDIAGALFNMVQSEYVDKYLKKYNTDLEEIFRHIDTAWKKKPQSIKTAQPIEIYNIVKANSDKWRADNNKNGENEPILGIDIKQFREHEKEWLTEKDYLSATKRGIPLTKSFETVDMPHKNNTVTKNEFPHLINLKVNNVHAIDFAGLTDAFRRTFEETEKPLTAEEEFAKENVREVIDTVKYGTMSVHDAIAAIAPFSLAFQKNYRKSMVDINYVYDIGKMAGYAYKSMRGSNENIASKFISKMEVLENNKKDMIESDKFNSDTSKIFGFDNKLPNHKINKKQKSFDNEAKQAVKDVKKEHEAHKGSLKTFTHVTNNEAKTEYGHVMNAFKNAKSILNWDTETSGLNPESKNRPAGSVYDPKTGKYSVVPSQVIQFGYSVFDPKTGKTVSAEPIHLDSLFIDEGAEYTHGISSEELLKRTNNDKARDARTKKERVEYNMKKLLEIRDVIDTYSHKMAFNADFDMKSLALTWDAYAKEANKYDSSIDTTNPFDNNTLDIRSAMAHKANITDNYTPKKYLTMQEAINSIPKIKKTEKYNEKNSHGAVYDSELIGTLSKYLLSDESSNKKGDLISGESRTPEQISKLKAKDIDTLMSDYAEDSDIIKDFIENPKNKDKVVYNENEDLSTYDSGFHEIELIKEDDGEIQRFKDQQKRSLEHEIIHYNTVGFAFNNQSDKDVKYLSTMIDILKRSKSKSKEIFDKLKLDRSKSVFNYLIRDLEFENVEELIAIAKTEPAVIDDIANALEKPSFKTKVLALLNKVLKWMKLDGKYNFGEATFNSGRIYKASSNINEKGKVYNKNEKEALLGRRREDKIVGDQKKEYNANKKLKNKTTKKESPAGEKTGKQRLKEQLDYIYSPEKIEYSSDPLSYWARNGNDYLADILWNRLGPQAESIVAGGSKKIDKWLSENSEAYINTKETLTDIWKSETMQGIKAYIAPSLIGNREDLMDFNQIATTASQRKHKIISTELADLERMMSGISKKDIENLNAIFGKTPIFGLASNLGLLREIADGSKTIDDAIIQVEALSNNTEDIRIADQHAELYINQKAAKGMKYNSHLEGIPGREAIIEQLTALYSLKKIDNAENTIRDLFKNKFELYNAIVSKSLSNALLTKQIYADNNSPKGYRGNMTLDFYEDAVHIEAVPEKDFHKTKYHNKDYKILVLPKDNYGTAIVARNIDNVSYQEGYGTNIGYGTTDVLMPEEFDGSDKDGFVGIESGNKIRYRYVLTADNQKTLNMKENPADTLIRSYAHIREVHETQAIRDKIMEDTGGQLVQKILSLTDASIKQIQKQMNNNTAAYFIYLDDEVDYTKLPDDIKNKYSYIDNKLSTIKNFNQKVTLVRNDIKHYLTGYQRAFPFKDNPELRKAFTVIQQLISFMKIHQIIINPAKIALDNIATTTLLISNGISPLFILNNGRKVIGQITEWSKLNGQYVHYSMLAHAGDTKAKYMLKKIETKIKSHPLAGSMNAGVQQSISTDILMRDYDTITGLQKNIENILNKYTMHGDKVPNNLGKAIMWFAKAGFNIEDLTRKIAATMESKEGFEAMSDEIKYMSDRMSTIKNNNEAGKYIAEFFGSPSSNLTRIGSFFTMYPDMLSRIIYRNHLIATYGTIAKADLVKKLKNKEITKSKYNSEIIRTSKINTESQMNESDIYFINKKTSDMMPDYNYFPPMMLDALGRWYVTPFITFTSRIQRVIANLAERNPMTMLGSAALAAAIGVSWEDTPYHIVGSNFITKDQYINDVFTSLMDPTTIFPTNVFNFDIIRG